MNAPQRSMTYCLPPIIVHGLPRRASTAFVSSWISCIGTCTERLISDGSRPTSSQCFCTMPQCRFKSSGPQMAFMMSPYLASVRSVRFGPVPPTISGILRVTPFGANGACFSW